MGVVQNILLIYFIFDIKNVRLMECDTVNRNGRIYPKEVVEKALEEYHHRNSSEVMFGHMGESRYNENGIMLVNVSHSIENIHMDGNFVTGDIRVLDTPKGKDAQRWLQSGQSLSCIPYGTGSMNEDGEIQEFHINGFNVNFDGAFDNCKFKI